MTPKALDWAFRLMLVAGLVQFASQGITPALIFSVGAVWGLLVFTMITKYRSRHLPFALVIASVALGGALIEASPLVAPEERSAQFAERPDQILWATGFAVIALGVGGALRAWARSRLAASSRSGDNP